MITRAGPGGSSPQEPAERRRSRAVLREVVPGSHVDCAFCGEPVKFRARLRHQTVICNVYVDGHWKRVDHYHADCYREAGRPHGPPDTTAVRAPRASRQSPGTRSR